MPLKITTWNLEHSSRLVSDNPSADVAARRNRVRQTLEEINPDILCIQEGPKGEQAIADFSRQVTQSVQRVGILKQKFSLRVQDGIFYPTVMQPLTFFRHRVVYELRYRGGLRYLDRCGSTIDNILTSHPDWIIRGEQEISPQNAPLVNLDSGMRLNLGPYKYDFSLEQLAARDQPIKEQDILDFTAQVDSISRIIHDELQLKNFTREGFRMWFLAATHTEEEAQKWISEVALVTVKDALQTFFGGTLKSQQHALIIAGEDRNFRIAIADVERLARIDLGAEVISTKPRQLPKGQNEALLTKLKAQHRLQINPHHAVMIDVDAFIDDPLEADPADFINSSFREIENNLSKIDGVRI